MLKDRRSVARGSVLTAAALLAASGLAVALGSSPAAASKAKAPTQVLHIAESLVQPTLDPATDIQYESDELASVYDTLVTVLPGGSIGPDLATSWKVRNRSITFQLRKNVKFQDGTPFNAQAVKDELDRIENPATQATNAKSVLGPYVKSTVLGPYTIEITWSTPYSGALTDLGNADLSIPSPKAAAAGTLATHPVGTGPYEFVSYTPGEQLVLKRNPNYTTIRPDLTNKGAPEYAEIVFQYVTDESTRANLLETGGTQITRLDGTYARTAYSSSQLDHYEFPSISEYWLAINSQRISNFHVRQAIYAAVNRKALIAATADGFGRLNTNAIPTSILGYDSSIRVTPYDVQQAKQDLAQAGYKLDSNGVMAKNGHELAFEILSANQDPYPEMDQIVQNELSQVGIKTTIETQVQASVTLARRQGGQGIYIGTYGILDSAGSMGILFGCQNIPSAANPLGTNILFWCNTQFDKDLAAASADTANVKARQAKLVAAQRILESKDVSLTLYQPETVVFGSKSVSGISLQPDGILRINDLAPSS